MQVDSTGYGFFTAPFFTCSATENITTLFTPSYIVNLAFMTEFFNANSLENIAPDHLLHEEIEVDLPKLTIATKEYDAKFATGQELAYDNEMIMASLDRLDGKHFDVFNVFHWIILIIGIAATAALVWLFILHNKYRSIVLLAAKGTPAQMATDAITKVITVQSITTADPN